MKLLFPKSAAHEIAASNIAFDNFIYLVIDVLLKFMEKLINQSYIIIMHI